MFIEIHIHFAVAVVAVVAVVVEDADDCVRAVVDGFLCPPAILNTNTHYECIRTIAMP